MIVRRIIQSRHARRNLDPSLPLFVLRRLPAGARTLLPGEPFDPAGIDPRRLGFLYRNRYIGHEPSRSQRQAVPRQPPTVAPAVVVVSEEPAVPAPVEPPAPAKSAKRARAGA